MFDDPHSFEELFWPMVVEGVFLGSFFTPLTVLTLHGLSGPLVTRAAEIANLLRVAAGAFGITFQGIVLFRRTHFHQLHLADHFGGCQWISYDPLEKLSVKLSAAGLNPSEIQAKVGALIKQQASILSLNDETHILRSHENGGGALGRVNRARNRVESGQSGELHSNIRFTSERPVPGLSTVDRMIMLPGLTETWEAGPFDRETSEHLWSRESIERQAHAISALTHWVFSRLTEMSDYFIEARNLTRQWNVRARTADCYAAVVAAHYIFRAFAAEHDVDTNSALNIAVEALRRCAEKQTQSKLSPADLFRSWLRLAIADGLISFTGRPLVNARGEAEREYTSPFVYVTEEASEDGVIERTAQRPPHITLLSELGLTQSGATNAKANVGISPHGYVVPPSTGHHRNETSTKWQLMCTREQLERLANVLTKYCRDKDGTVFTADWIRNLIVSDLKVGKKDKRRMSVNEDGHDAADRVNVLSIDMEWLFEPLTDGGDE